MEEEKKEEKKMMQNTNSSVFDEMPAKFAFWSGIVTGAAVLSVIGVIVMVTLMVKGIGLTPSTEGEGEKNTNVANTNTAPAANAAPTNAAPSGNSGVEEASGSFDVASASHVRGSGGNVAIVEFSDFECPFCQRFTPTMEQVMEKYDGKVQHVYKHFPLSNIHPQAELAAIGSECAGEQGKFWEMHDSLFENQDLLTGKEAVVKMATDLGLEKEAFTKCLADPAKKAIVTEDASEGQALGCTGTPCPLLVVDGKVVKKFAGAVPFDVVDTALQEYVK